MIQRDHRKPFKELGEHLTDLVGNKLSNKQIADALDVSEPAVSQWLSGHKRPDRKQKYLLKLCGLLQALLEDVEEAFALGGYYLTPEEIAEINAWQPADQDSPALEMYNDLTSWLSAIRGSKSGIELEVGLRSAKSLMKRIDQHILIPA
jgi:transcriptional regulator with XRE-family HTH domain